jgi:hypothetical protein
VLSYLTDRADQDWLTRFADVLLRENTTLECAKWLNVRVPYNAILERAEHWIIALETNPTFRQDVELTIAWTMDWDHYLGSARTWNNSQSFAALTRDRSDLVQAGITERTETVHHKTVIHLVCSSRGCSFRILLTK